MVMVIFTGIQHTFGMSIYTCQVYNIQEDQFPHSSVLASISVACLSYFEGDPIGHTCPCDLMLFRNAATEVTSACTYSTYTWYVAEKSC